MSNTRAEVPPSLDGGGTEPTMSQFANKEDYLQARVDQLEQALSDIQERCAVEVDNLIAIARPVCEANYTDGDSWLESAAAAIRALGKAAAKGTAE